MAELSREQRLGTVTVSLPAEVTVGSTCEFTLRYSTGFFGVDDSGSIKICYRYATDMGVPQFDDPRAPNYVRVSSNAEVTLVPRFDTKDNVRPWGKTIYIKVTNGYLVEGDWIDVTFGDRSGGSSGIRVQTFCEGSFEFRLLADVFACYRYEQVPSPLRDDDQTLKANEIRLVAGDAVKWRGQTPSTVETGETFDLRIRAEDVWGNPTAVATEAIRFETDSGIDGLSDTCAVDATSPIVRVPGLSCTQSGVYRIHATTSEGDTIAIAPIRCEKALSKRAYWADLHGQSEETIGTNSVVDYFTFARDFAWVDVAGHQGNDFQITPEFWTALQQATREFNEPGRFVTFPGYEWSANTGLGGDHNVYYLNEGETIHRSCHALVDDLSDLDTDCNRIDELFEALAGRDAMVFAHVGGRYAVLPVHDPAIQRAVEIHSAWGTFEWLLEDAFSLGHRMGVVCNSDGHKGRPGASYPGASLFGSYGGLTCLLAGELTREAIWEAYRRRHHYGTTGARIGLSVTADFDRNGTLLDATGADESPEVRGTRYVMGDIVRSDSERVKLSVSVNGTVPIERVELRNGSELLETVRPYDAKEIGSRIRVIWRGAAFRGRGRQIDWNGGIEVAGNRITGFDTVNFYNPDRVARITEDRADHTSLSWRSFTTGGIAGVNIALADPHDGIIRFSAGPVSFEIPIEEIGPACDELSDRVFTAEGIDVGVTLTRLPDVNEHLDFELEREVSLVPGRDNPLYVCVIQEDGHMAWSSPVYAVHE